MELGLQIPDFTWAGGPARLGADLAAVARAADEAGFAYLAVMDHFFQIRSVGPSDHDMLEAYTTLGYLAAHTERVKLFTLVTGVLYRHPGLLAKAITTLDVLSGGRAILGIGAGWNEEESRGLGFPFPPTKERFELLEENLRYVQQMWEEGDEPFTSKHFAAERLLNVPQSLQRPHPPIMVGGGGEKKTLRFVAQYGDMCNLFNGPDLEHKLDVLKQHCENEGRDYAEITKTVYQPLDIGPDGEKADELKAELERLRGLGVDAAIGFLPGVPDLRLIEKFANDIIPAAKELA
ncbi:LLM class F420-dependent oxidoreductase [Amycolatopsis benzoatilytica]|uniref:LLM class F420-dependent oxidoreductase n=1 Tax=Amycolatopsis benzoatilytica TaxID=346045 RepID=UPI00035E76DB|nr:LLM class F420-dependent oxidoreductase [Amycolatopsis benzoatilytica]